MSGITRTVVFAAAALGIVAFASATAGLSIAAANSDQPVTAPQPALALSDWQ